MMNYHDIGLQVPQILLPRGDVPLASWAVVACDQFTSQPDYWDQVRRLVGDRVSALHLVLPELYLDQPDRKDRIVRINETMRSYLERGLLVPLEPGFVLVQRQWPGRPSRWGLMVGLDLEQYDYAGDSRSLIRPTEGTVVSRLPPRVQIRREARLELPHTMVLIDDPGRTVIEPVHEVVRHSRPLYDFELMQEGGRVRGWLLTGAQALDGVADRLRGLLRGDSAGSMLYAVGDGNHSLAAARNVWEGVKRDAADRHQVHNHPARYVLVELVNIHDEAIKLAPIHRLVTGVEGDDLVERMVQFHRERGVDLEICEWSAETRETGEAGVGDQPIQHIPFATRHRRGMLKVRRAAALQVVTMVDVVEAYCRQFQELAIDYIHGDDVIETLASRPGIVGFLAQAIDKEDLFPIVQRDGPLPSKSFSMGEAEEKRYYLEARCIR